MKLVYCGLLKNRSMGGRESGKDLRGGGGRETMIGIYCMEKLIFNKK